MLNLYNKYTAKKHITSLFKNYYPYLLNKKLYEINVIKDIEYANSTQTADIETFINAKYNSSIYHKLFISCVKHKRCIVFNIRLRDKSDNHKEFLNMTMLPTYILDHIETPDSNIVEYNLANADLFTEILKAFAQPDSIVRKNNSVQALANENFAYHPSIHRGYYDVLKDGVLFVVDYETKELIKKQDSILLANGRFLSKKSKLICYDFSIHRKTIQRILAGDEKALESLSNLWFPYTDNGLLSVTTYFKLDKKYFKPYYSASVMSELVRNTYFNYCAMMNLEITLQDIEDLPHQDYLEYMLKQITAQPPAVLICLPNDKTSKKLVQMSQSRPIFKDLYIYDNYFSSSIVSTSDLGFQLDVANLRYDAELFSQSRGFTVVKNEDLVFSFIVRCQDLKLQKRKSIKTQNNDGHLLSYSSKVDELKASFLMLPEEELLFERYRQNYVTKARANRKIILAARKEGKNIEVASTSLAAEEQPIFMGLELEVVGKGDYASSEGVAKIIRDISNSSFGDHCIMKSDSSIGNNGLELVTVPATLGYHAKMFEEHFFNKDNAFHKRIAVTERCGIHIHISKKSFTPLTLGKFSHFINSMGNSDFMNKMAGRTPNTYCQRVPTTPKNIKGVSVAAAALVRSALNYDDNGKLKGLSFRRLDTNRREAVNLQNAHTVEVRIFKATSEKNNLIRKLEFCESLVKFVRCHSTQQMTAYDYVNFLLDKTNKKAYPHLILWLASKNYIGHETRKIKGKAKLAHIYEKNLLPIPDSIYHQTKNKEQK